MSIRKPFAVLIVYRDGKSNAVRLASRTETVAYLDSVRLTSNVAYAQANGPSGIVDRYVATHF